MDGNVNGRGDLVDWKEIGIRFRQMGYTLSDVARAMNEPVSNVHGWLYRGVQPRYDKGVLLLGIYNRLESGRLNMLSS